MLKIQVFRQTKTKQHVFKEEIMTRLVINIDGQIKIFRFTRYMK